MEVISEPVISIVKFDLESATQTVNNINKAVSLFGSEQPLVFNIESYGGEAAGLSIIYNKIKSLQNPIITYCSGTAMSGGFFLFVNAASKPNRILAPTATLMLHEVQTGYAGDIKDVESHAKHSRELSDIWMDITAKSMGYENRDKLKEFVYTKTKSHDFFMTASQALEYGFADMIGSVVVSPPSIKFDVHCVSQVVVPKEEPKKVKKKKK